MVSKVCENCSFYKGYGDCDQLNKHLSNHEGVDIIINNPVSFSCNDFDVKRICRTCKYWLKGDEFMYCSFIYVEQDVVVKTKDEFG